MPSPASFLASSAKPNRSKRVAFLRRRCTPDQKSSNGKGKNIACPKYCSLATTRRLMSGKIKCAKSRCHPSWLYKEVCEHPTWLSHSSDIVCGYEYTTVIGGSRRPLFARTRTHRALEGFRR